MNESKIMTLLYNDIYIIDDVRNKRLVNLHVQIVARHVKNANFILFND